MPDIKNKLLHCMSHMYLSDLGTERYTKFNNVSKSVESQFFSICIFLAGKQQRQEKRHCNFKARRLTCILEASCYLLSDLYQNVAITPTCVRDILNWQFFTKNIKFYEYATSARRLTGRETYIRLQDCYLLLPFCRVYYQLHCQLLQSRLIS